jgi:hypothetical protein
MAGPSATVIAVALALSLAGGAGGGRRDTPGLTPTERTALLLRYQPVTYIARGELWAPTTVDPFLSAARVETRTTDERWRPAAAGDLPVDRGSCAKTPCYRLNDRRCVLAAGPACYEKLARAANPWADTAVYASLVDLGKQASGLPSAAGKPRYLLHYVYFYGFDEWRWRVLGRTTPFVQVHEADWEGVTIGLSSEASPRPLFAAYSSHCGGSWRPWAQVPVVAATHPKVYVALGSHANYFRAGSITSRPFQCKYRKLGRGLAGWVKSALDVVTRVVDRTGTDRELRPEALGGNVTKLVELPTPAPRWTHFAGSWSEGNLVESTGTRVRSLFLDDGPRTPSFTANNLRTIFTDERWHRG